MDRIAAPKLTEESSVSAPKSFDLAAFVKSTFQMFDGPLLDVTLKCENMLMKTIIDRFGEGVDTEIADGAHFLARVSVAASNTFYGWVFGLGGAVEITDPSEAVTAYREMAKRICAFEAPCFPKNKGRRKPYKRK